MISRLQVMSFVATVNKAVTFHYIFLAYVETERPCRSQNGAWKWKEGSVTTSRVICVHKLNILNVLKCCLCLLRPAYTQVRTQSRLREFAHESWLIGSALCEMSKQFETTRKKHDLIFHLLSPAILNRNQHKHTYTFHSTRAREN